MLTRRLTLVAAVVAALPVAVAVAQERARPRGTGSRGRIATAPAASPRAQPRPRLTEAQRRHPRAGTGTNWARRGYPYYGQRRHYPRWGYPGWGSVGWRYGWGYPDYGWGGYYGYYGYYGGGYWSPGPAYAYAYVAPVPVAPYGSLRLIVEPLDARVLVDGHYAGVVDDFDGLFQRLNVAPGPHEIRIERESYRTHRFSIYVQEGETLRLRHQMVAGEGESEERVGAETAPEPPPQQRAAPQPPTTVEPPPAVVRLEVQPADATVYVDGAFAGSAREVRELVLPPGRHRLELVRPGHRTLEREIELGPGDQRSLELRLEPAG